jgi:BON domain-containing protein
MNRSLFARQGSKLPAWLAVAVLSSAMAFAQEPAAAAGQRTDGQIEMDVVHALDGEQTLKNDLITAATIEGEVTLAGTVSTDASKKLAESVAAKVPGVTKVNNNLTVGNPQDAKNAQAPVADPNDDGPQTATNTQREQAPPPPQDYPSAGPADDGGEYSQNAPNQPYPQGEQYPQNAPNQPYPQGGQYPQSRPGYGSPYPPQYRQPQYRVANGPVTIPPGTLLQLRTMEPVASKRAQDGEPVQFTLISDITAGGALAIPRGAVFHGVVTERHQPGSGQLSGNAVLALQLTAMDLGGQTYQITSDEFRVKGPNKAGQTVGNAVGAGLVGTIIGCAVGRGVGCAVGAGAGVAAGTAATAASSGPGVWIPAEALVSFHLTAPLTVSPVSQEEAARLAQGLYPGGPTMYRRPPAPYPYYRPRMYYGRPYPYAPYPYYYPRVYYRPYFMAGGVYYWR